MSESAGTGHTSPDPYCPGSGSGDDADVEEKYAINLDDVAQQLMIPVESLSEPLLTGSCSSSVFANNGSAAGAASASYSRPHRASIISVRASRSGTVIDQSSDQNNTSIHHERSEPISVVRRESGFAVRVESGSFAAGRSFSAATANAASYAGAATASEASPLVASSPSKKAKRVHFPDNVVESVCIVPPNEAVAGSQPELQVKYRRPWYAYVIFLASNVFFVFAWTEIMKAAWPSKWPGEDLTAAVSVVSFTSFGFTAAFMLAYLLLTWRPLEFESSILQTTWFRIQMFKVVFYGSVAQILLMLSCMQHITCVNFLAFSTAPLIAMFLHEKCQHRGLTPLDTLGTLAATVGLVILCVGEEKADLGSRVHRFGAIGTSLLGGIFMAPYLSELRRVSKDVSNALVITVTVIVATLISAVIACITHGFTTPLGNGTDIRSVFSDLSNEELLRVMLSGAFMFFFWLLHHIVSTYFDRLSIVAGYSLCAPIVIAVYHIQELPTMNEAFEIVGGSIVTLGCSMVVFSGWYFRTVVAIRLDMD